MILRGIDPGTVGPFALINDAGKVVGLGDLPTHTVARANGRLKLELDLHSLCQLLREALAQLQWTFAKTIPHIPHYYVARGKTAPEDLYVRLFTAIRCRGVDQRYGPCRNRYLYLGDGHKYWAMTGDVTKSRVINRDTMLDPKDWVWERKALSLFRTIMRRRTRPRCCARCRSAASAGRVPSTRRRW
jgi:hypothetical protein